MQEDETPPQDWYPTIEQNPDGQRWDWAVYNEDPAVWESTPENNGTAPTLGAAYLAVGAAVNFLVQGAHVAA